MTPQVSVCSADALGGLWRLDALMPVRGGACGQLADVPAPEPVGECGVGPRGCTALVHGEGERGGWLVAGTRDGRVRLVGGGTGCNVGVSEWARPGPRGLQLAR